MKIIEVNEKLIEIRALTRGEIKTLKDVGYSYFGCIPSMDHANDSQDQCLEKVLSPDDLVFLDTCSNQDATHVWTEILKETYGAPDEEKNLQSTSDGTQTKTE